MKVKLSLMVCALLISGSLLAQDKQKQPREGQKREQHQRPPRITLEERAKIQADRMKTELGLTDAQYDSVKSVHLRHAKKTEESLKNRSADRRAEFQQDQETLNADLKKILTEEQLKKFEANREKSKERRQRPGGHKP
jgi:hypothetical protein